MKRFLRRLLIAIPLLLLALLLGLVLFLQCGGLDYAIREGAAYAGPRYLGSDIVVSNAHTRLLSGTAELGGIVIGPPRDLHPADPENPVSFDANVFEMNSFRVDYSARSVIGVARGTTNVVHVNEIVIDGPFVTYEVKGHDFGLRDNLHQLLANLGGEPAPAPENGAAAPAPEAPAAPAAPAPAPDPDAKPPVKVIIDHFVFTNAHVRVAVAGGKGLVLPLPTIVLDGIGAKSGGATALEATLQILESIAMGVVSLVGDAGQLVLDAGKAVVGGAVEGVTAVGEGLLSGASAVGDGLSSATDAVGDAIGSVGGLLGLGGDGD